MEMMWRFADTISPLAAWPRVLLTCRPDVPWPLNGAGDPD
jgi:hypothetical protein